MNWTAVTKRLTRPDRVATELAPDDADLGRDIAGQEPAQDITTARPETAPAQAPLRASSVRAFTPRDAYMPRHRANVPTDWVADHDTFSELRRTEVAATA